MPLHLVLNISSRWEKLCEILPIIGGLNVISCCTIHNLFLDVQWMSAKASILGKLSCHCKTFQSYSLSFVHIITVFVSETCRSDRLDVLAVTEGCVHWPMADSDWPRWCQATLPTSGPWLANWLVFTQNTHMGWWADECYYATGHTHSN